MNALEIDLHLSRAEDAELPFAFAWKSQRYTRHFADGQVRASELTWPGAVEALLDGLAEEPPRADTLVRLGEALRAFLRGVGWDADEAGLIEAVDERRPAVVSLRFAAAELYALPWETLQVGPRGLRLGNLPGVTVRYAWPGVTAVEGFPAAPRLLYAWSAGGGAVPAEEHLAELSRVLPPGSFDPAKDVVADTSYRAFAKALRAGAEEGRPYTAVHLLAHGLPLEGSTTIGLAFSGRVVDGDTLKQLLADHAAALRLVTVCACRGADPGRLDTHLGSVAQQIHRSGVACVVASRLPLSFAGSKDLAGALYEGLDFSSPSGVARAFREARVVLREGDHPSDGDALQLYTAEAIGPMTPPGPVTPPVPMTAPSVEVPRAPVEPAPPPRAVSPRRALAELLVSLFSADELRRFIRYLPDGTRLAQELPTGGSPAGLAEEVTGLLEREGMVDQGFFDTLVAERPGRRKDIDAVRARWSGP